MPNFSYRGRDASGQMTQGILEGLTSAAVADALMSRGIIPLSINPASEGAKTDGSGSKLADLSKLAIFKQPVQHIDVLMFSKQIYTLLKAGVPIMRALAGLQESSVNPTMKEVLQEVRESLDSGRELSVSLARHPKVFSAFYLSMVRVGEMTGRLEEVFIRLFEHMEFEAFMKQQVKSALRYPSFVIAAMVIAMFIVNIFVIPTFAKVFAGFNTELPLMTRVLLAFSNFMVTWWHLIIGAMVATFFAFRSWAATPSGRLKWDEIKLRLPIAGKILRKATLARFARSFALATRSGVPIIQALTNVALTVDNDFISRKVEGMREGVERGESILQVATKAAVFTPVVLQMLAVGEESGAIDDMMEEIAGMYQNEVEYELKTLAQQIEPILIVMLGCMVLVLALGIFLPIWELGKAAMKH
ncbi:MAG: type II secretion system F family protein [Betaproteobacteria bacterium]|nr:type II secretion system F family protein [Betaproteobacteria bacterium]